MSTIGKINLGFKKIDTQTDKPLAQGFKTLIFAHQWTSAGQTDMSLTGLNAPSLMTTDGFTNPSQSDMLSANLYINRQNLRLMSSVNGALIDYLSYDVISNSLIRFKSGAQSQVNEIIVGYITPVNMTGLLAVPGNPIVQTGTIVSGSTDIVVNQPFIYSNYTPQQVGDVLYYLGSPLALQLRNIGNTSVVSGGTFYEVAPSSGNLSNVLRMNSGVSGNLPYAIVSNGFTVQAPTSQGLAAINSLANQVYTMALDLAQTTGNPVSNYFPTGPSLVDLSMFGSLVKSFISGIHYDAVVGSATQFANGQCTHTSVQTAINYVGGLTNTGRILVLQGTYTENITLVNKITLEGKGAISFINGTLTLNAGASESMVKWLKFGGNISVSVGVINCFITECWQSTGFTITDSIGSNNLISVITE